MTDSTAKTMEIPVGFTSITEGKATILFPTDNGVFYNPVQQFNRDLSIAAIRCWAEGKREKLKRQNAKFKLCEALSASGLRSIRYAKELVDYLQSIIANDMSADAVESIRRNCEFNNVAPELVVPNKADACDLMYAHRKPEQRFDIVDIDPYGSAAPFLDSAIQSVADGGLLLVTCTDMAVLAGQRHETCFYKYGGVPLKSEFCHEMALRILIHALNSTAARYQRQIVPLVSLSIDFYVRIFVRVETSANALKQLASQTSLVYQCANCRSFLTGPLGTVHSRPAEPNNIHYSWARPVCGSQCEFCDGPHHVGGPVWTGPLHNQEFLQSLLTHIKQSPTIYQTHQRMLGMITVASEELEEPFYYSLPSLAKMTRTSSPPLLTFNSALLNAGYRVSTTHCAHGAIKTSAPPSVIWAIMQAWAKHSQAKSDFPPETVVAKLRNFKPLAPPLIVDFTMHPDANPPSRRIKLVRFADNKGKNWGPKSRAKRRKVDAGSNDDSGEGNKQSGVTEVGD